MAGIVSCFFSLLSLHIRRLRWLALKIAIFRAVVQAPPPSPPREADLCAQSIQTLDDPPFTVCGPPGYRCFVGGLYPTDVGDEHDCDILPLLMEMASPTGADRSGELFLDLGSNVGQCSWLMLSKGYQAVTIEGEQHFHPWINATLQANRGWPERATVHHFMVGSHGEDTRRLADILSPSAVVRLWKFDVDGHELSVLQSFEQGLREGRVDVIEMELIQEETLQESSIHKDEVLRYLEGHGYRLYAIFVPDRFDSYLDFSEVSTFRKICKWARHLKDDWGLVDVSVPWVNLPVVDEAVLPPSYASLYTYGESRASNFAVVPMCAGNSTAQKDGTRSAPRRAAWCMNHYLAVRPGSHMERHPSFAPEAHSCASEATSENQRFKTAVFTKLKEAVDKGWAAIGEDPPLRFVAKVKDGHVPIHLAGKAELKQHEEL